MSLVNPFYITHVNSDCNDILLRGTKTEVGSHLTVEQCQQKCIDLGPKVCNNIEYGGEKIEYKCKLWSGTCYPRLPGYDSIIYAKYTDEELADLNEKQIELMKQELQKRAL